MLQTVAFARVREELGKQKQRSAFSASRLRDRGRRNLARSRAQKIGKEKGKCYSPETQERREELPNRRCRIKSMTKKGISPGAVHSVPADLRRVLISDPMARAKWEDITPLARNEWICWVVSVKKPETRRQHIERVRTELKEGMRRPCCWPGCPHR